MTKKITLILTSRQEDWLKRVIKSTYYDIGACILESQNYPAIKESLEIDQKNAKVVLEELGCDLVGEME